MLIDVDWCWLMLIDVDWCWLVACLLPLLIDCLVHWFRFLLGGGFFGLWSCPSCWSVSWLLIVWRLNWLLAELMFLRTSISLEAGLSPEEGSPLKTRHVCPNHVCFFKWLGGHRRSSSLVAWLDEGPKPDYRHIGVSREAAAGWGGAGLRLLDKPRWKRPCRLVSKAPGVWSESAFWNSDHWIRWENDICCFLTDIRWDPLGSPRFDLFFTCVFLIL